MPLIKIIKKNYFNIEFLVSQNNTKMYYIMYITVVILLSKYTCVAQLT